VNCVGSNDLRDLEKWNTRNQIFPADPRMYDRTAWYKATKFGITHVVQTEACFYGGQPRHPSQGVEPKRSQILGPYLGPHGLTRATKFGWVTHVRRPSEGRASSGQQLRRPSFQESSAPASPIFLTATKFCMVIKLDEGKIFTGSTAPLALAKIFRDTNDAGSVYGIVR